MANGTIKTLVRERGFGFIKEDGSAVDLFFHRSAVSGTDFENLAEGQAVEFDIQPDPRNSARTQAANVRVGG
jgi:CspA family cold shock protein